jgi:hypothetical protein
VFDFYCVLYTVKIIFHNIFKIYLGNLSGFSTVYSILVVAVIAQDKGFLTINSLKFLL